MNTIIDALRHEIRMVAENLERREWIQGELQNGEAVCAHGAVMACQGLKPGDEHIIRAVMRSKGLTEGWNDTDGRTKTEVLRKFAEIAGVSDADLEAMFGPNWRQVVAVVRRAAVLTEDEAQRLQVARAAAGDAWAAWDAARDAAWDAAAGAAAWDAAEAAAGDATRDAAAGAAAWAAAQAAVVADLVGRHGLTQNHIDTLMRPWVDVLGSDWDEGMVE